MTDSEMKRFLDNLLRDEHDFDDTEIAIALLAAVAMEKNTGKVNTQDWISTR